MTSVEEEVKVGEAAAAVEVGEAGEKEVPEGQPEAAGEGDDKKPEEHAAEGALEAGEGDDKKPEEQEAPTIPDEKATLNGHKAHDEGEGAQTEEVPPTEEAVAPTVTEAEVAKSATGEKYAGLGEEERAEKAEKKNAKLDKYKEKLICIETATEQYIKDKTDKYTLKVKKYSAQVFDLLNPQAKDSIKEEILEKSPNKEEASKVETEADTA